MEDKRCSICRARITMTDAPILTMGAYGNPKYLCGSCAEELEAATLSRDINEIGISMENIGKKLADTNPDKSTFDTVSEILGKAGERAKKIEDGSYDFSLDTEATEEAFDDIPEELLETDEDRELDRREAESNAKVNKILDYVNIGLVIGILGFAAWIVIKMFL